MSLKWQPEGGVDAFRDKCLEKRGRGISWRSIAKGEGISHQTLYVWMREQGDFQKTIKKQEKAEVREQIRQTLIFMAVEKKNVTALIYLAKSLCKMWDQPHQQPEPKKPNEPEQHPSMTPEKAKELLTARLKLVPEKP